MKKKRHRKVGGRPKKDYTALHIKCDRKLFNRTQRFARKWKRTVTDVVECALDLYTSYKPQEKDAG